MSFTEIATFLGFAALVLVTQLGRHAFTLRRLLLPVALVIGIGYQYVQSIPTAGGDLDFEMICAAAGAAFGVLAASVMHVEREPGGRVVTVAGIVYAAVWLIVLGGRLAFGWAASSVWQHQVAQFSLAHAITSSAAWTAAFVLMALAMVVARTAVIALRALPLLGTMQRVHAPSL